MFKLILKKLIWKGFYKLIMDKISLIYKKSI